MCDDILSGLQNPLDEPRDEAGDGVVDVNVDRPVDAALETGTTLVNEAVTNLLTALGLGLAEADVTATAPVCDAGRLIA